MADLSAVLRKTIDGLPGSSPQLRAKVYEKARSAIERQIAAANPPLSEEAAEVRRRSLGDAIERTEAHYIALEDGGDAEAPQAAEPMTPSLPTGGAPGGLQPPASSPANHSGAVGEAGPAALEVPDSSGNDDARASSADTAIPAPDMAAPRYSSARKGPVPPRKSKAPLYVGVAVALLVGGAGAAYMAGSDFGGLLQRDNLPVQTADPAAEGTDGGEVPDTAVTEVPPEAISPDQAGEAAGGPAVPPASEPGAREYTQRLMPDGTETDAGPGTSSTNVFDEGTDVSTASPATQPAPATAPAQAQGTPASGAEVPEGAEVAVFYEERFNDTPGAQHAGTVVWSVVEEAPADGQPPEPAVRAVVQIPDSSLSMTMTIRRNADATLPASHVIEMLFDVPDNFAGGEVANVQRLALKPTEQDRGRPLIGVAGKISDGFFWIALNDLQQAVQDNLALMANEKWIDVPIAYETGQRALLSIEKGPEGEAAFRQAMTAWDART